MMSIIACLTINCKLKIRTRKFTKHIIYISSMMIWFILFIYDLWQIFITKSNSNKKTLHSINLLSNNLNKTLKFSLSFSEYTIKICGMITSLKYLIWKAGCGRTCASFCCFLFFIYFSPRAEAKKIYLFIFYFWYEKICLVSSGTSELCELFWIINFTLMSRRNTTAFLSFFSSPAGIQIFIYSDYVTILLD